jgi:hypothetical protein
MSTLDTNSGPVGAEPNRLEDTKWSLAEVWRRYGGWAITLVNLSIFFSLWELFARSGAVNPLFLPTASDMFAALWHGLTTTAPPGSVISGSIADHLFFTLRNLGIGLVIAGLIGIPAGLLMGGNKYVETILSPMSGRWHRCRASRSCPCSSCSSASRSGCRSPSSCFRRCFRSSSTPGPA